MRTGVAIYLGVLFLGSVYLIWIAARIKPCYLAAMKTIDKISRVARADILIPWQWRYDLFEELEDDHLWLKVWKNINREYNAIAEKCCM